MRCPVCPDVKLEMTFRDGVEIDYCPDCRGIWLDRGELEKLLDRAAGEPITTPPRERRDDRPRYDEPRRDDRPRYDDDYYKKKKRKSFLDEIFDF